MKYKSVRLEESVYKKAELAKTLIKKPNGKNSSISTVVEKGLDLLLNDKKSF